MGEKQFDNPAKSSPKKTDKRKRRALRRQQRLDKEKKQKVGILGNFLLTLQAIVSILFVGTVFVLDMFPMKYLIVIISIVLFLFIVAAALQKRKRGRSVGGSLLSIILILILSLGSYYIAKVNGAVGSLTGGSYKIDKMVVAVLADDPAETINDAKEYSFGVQYQLRGTDVENTVNAINKNLGYEIATVEYQSIQEQAGALLDGNVQAIVYNEAYNGMLEEVYEDFESSIKVIYQYEIKTELLNMGAETNKEFSITEDCFNVYISGIDVYGPIATNSRSDVNIIATVNPKTHQILLTTTPRDYYVAIPGVSGGQKDKLTHAGIYGVDASIATLESLYETDINFYARVNFTSVVEIVDQLGGVDVYSEYEFTTLHGQCQVQKGMNHFNGEEALAFSRERYSLPGGDNQRGKNQQAVIVAMIKKMISPQLLIKAGGIIDSVSDNVETNLSEDQIQDLVKMQLDEGGAWNIYSIAATGTGESNYTYSMPERTLYVMNPDMESVQKIINLMKRVADGEKIEGSEVAQ